MRAGLLRDRLRIEQPAETIDATGAVLKSWTPVITVQAAIMPLGSGREYHQAGTDVSEADAKIRLRELPGFALDPAWRFIDDDRGAVFDIVSIEPARLRNELTVLVRQGGTRRP